MMRLGSTTIMTALAIASAAPALAQDAPRNPAIANYGTISPMPDGANQPDATIEYRVVFSITKAAASPDKINPSLEKVARFVNLLASNGVKPKPGDIVAIVHGAATPSVMTDAAYRAKFDATNPNLPLIVALEKAGVEVHVCSQALAGQKITKEAVAAPVTIDLSALTTLATLQLKGWAMIPD
jgi:intracellular sulfur oxidation DsrE/DsrF family protein